MTEERVTYLDDTPQPSVLEALAIRDRRIAELERERDDNAQALHEALNLLDLEEMRSAALARESERVCSGLQYVLQKHGLQTIPQPVTREEIAQSIARIEERLTEMEAHYVDSRLLMVRDERIAELEAQLAERDARRCGTCRHWFTVMQGDRPELCKCRRWQVYPAADFGCVLWRAREVSA